MRVRSVRIGSFGALRDRRYDLSGGMTVFHGPNESGKSTTMEFIRSVIVPSNRKNLYPERRKTDSGTIVYDEDGESRTAVLEGKSVTGDRPSLPVGTDDPVLFRSVFAMSPADLDDSKVVTEGEVRTRFLTVPGGESMPSAMMAAERLWSDSLGKRTTSKSRVLSLEGEAEDLDSSISEMRRGTDAYGEMDARRKVLKARLAELEAAEADRVESAKVRHLYESNAGNYRRLEELRRQRRELGEFERVTPADRETHEELASAYGKASASVDMLQRRASEAAEGLRGSDRRAVLAVADRIGALQGGLRGYREGVRAPPAPQPQSGKPSRALMGLAAVLAVAGIALAILVQTAFIILTVAGVAVAVAGLRTRPNVADDPHATSRRAAEEFSREVSLLMSELGLRSVGTEPDVAVLTEVLDAAKEAAGIENQILRARMDQSTARARLLEFTQRFSGEDGYADCLRRTELADGIDGSISALTGALRAAGLDPDEPLCPVDVPESSSAEISEINTDLGRLEQSMRQILDTTELERLMDRRAQVIADTEAALVDGAVGLVASAIADRACDEAYSAVQPGVVATADRYLSMMTDGRYRLDTDPRTMELSVRCGDESKGQAAWSSGLRAQVLLSVKLAVAREMGGGRVPVILDDVLLPFDSGRKAGACCALASVSKEMQVILFTCDAETAGICRDIDGVEAIEM